MPNVAALCPLACLLALAAGLGIARAEEAGGPILSCAGPLAADASHAKLLATFGDKAVVFREVEGAEGEKIGATILFPDDPKKRIELFWADEAHRSGLASAHPGPANRAAAPNGVRPGMSLVEVETLNGRPFELSGFGWDYGGFVTDWKGGALAKPAAGGCVVSVRFGLPTDTDVVAAKVAGDGNFSSRDPRMRKAKPVVEGLALGWPQP